MSGTVIPFPGAQSAQPLTKGQAAFDMLPPLTRRAVIDAMAEAMPRLLSLSDRFGDEELSGLVLRGVRQGIDHLEVAVDLGGAS
jgi:hypothetical protein